MALQETIDTLITEADAAGLTLGEVIQRIQQSQEDAELGKLIGSLQGLIVAAPGPQWQTIRTALITRRSKTPDRRDVVLRKIGAAVKTNNQPQFWRALLLLGLMVRDSLPHLDTEFKEPTVEGQVNG